MNQAFCIKGNLYSLDYGLPFVPDSVKKFKPVILVNTENKIIYYCIYGQDIRSKISGCGRTPIEAMLDWDKNFRNKPGSKTEVS